MLVNVFNAEDTAPLCVDAIMAAGSCDPGPKAERIATPEDWDEASIKARAATIVGDKGPEGDFDD
jgi:hypothetical protein